MADIKITNLPLGEEMIDQDELLYIDVSDTTAGPDGTDKRIKIGKLRNIANRQITTDFMINNTVIANNGDVVESQGFYVKGDGGGAQWVKTADNDTPSQTPADMGDAKFTDASGSVWSLNPDNYTKLPNVHLSKLGAKTDNSTDDGSVLVAAQYYIERMGGGVIMIPDGITRVSETAPICSNMSVIGSGVNSVLKQVNNGSIRPIFQFVASTRPNIEIENIEFRAFKMEGVFDENFIEEGVGGVVTLVGARNVTFKNMHYKWVSNFCINLNQCDDVTVTGCDFRYISRDAAAIWGTPNVNISNNSFIGTDDDCISVNQAGMESTNGKVRDGIRIVNNYLRDTGSINVQYAKNCVISDNIMKLCKGGFAIICEGVSFGEIYDSNSVNVIISNNIIVDLIDRLLSSRDNPEAESQNLRVGIALTAKAPTRKEYEAPYTDFYDDSGDQNQNQVNQPIGVKVSGNIIKRTVSGGQLYSALGLGKMFARFLEDAPEGYITDGFCDPMLTDTNFRVRPLEIRDSLTNSTIEFNDFQGSGDHGILFNASEKAAEDLDYYNLKIRGNTIRDFTSRGIMLADYIGTNQDITIEGNTIDGDPYNERVGRNADGTWTVLTNCMGVDANTVTGLKIESNTFKNLSYHSRLGTGGYTKNIVRNNKYVGEPSITQDPNSFDVTNKGMGAFPYASEIGMVLDYVDSDPTSPTYMTTIDQQLTSTNSASNPSSGYYFKGQTVVFTGDSQEGNFNTFGYKRLTSGNEHVNGVDWEKIQQIATVDNFNDQVRTTKLGGDGAGKLIGQGYMRTAGISRFFIEINSETTPVSISQNGSFSVYAGNGTLLGSGSVIMSQSLSSSAILVLDVSGLSSTSDANVYLTEGDLGGEVTINY